jgi:hypothetical protein
MNIHSSLTSIICSIDAPLPRECDDEYWMEHDSRYFNQPPEKPSLVAYFNCTIQLRTIQAFAMRTLVNS